MDSLQQEDKFINEIIWNNRRNLFDKYFKAQIYDDRYKNIYVYINDKLDFEQAMNLFKN